MKKLLYTLLIGLIVISCNKDNMEESIAPLSLDKEVSMDLEGMVDRLISTTKGNERKVSTSKAAAGDFITIYTNIVDGKIVEIAFDDSQEFCDPGNTGLLLFSLVLNADDSASVYQGDHLAEGATESFSIDNVAFLFDLSIKQAVRVSRDGTIETASVSGNVFSFE